jgi:hypothetical protein
VHVIGHDLPSAAQSFITADFDTQLESENCSKPGLPDFYPYNIPKCGE